MRLYTTVTHERFGIYVDEQLCDLCSESLHQPDNTRQLGDRESCTVCGEQCLDCVWEANQVVKLGL